MKKTIYLFAAALLMLGACTPDSHSLDAPSVQPADLTHGSAFSVSVDAQNTVSLKSLLDKSYNCYWIHIFEEIVSSLERLVATIISPSEML